MFKSVMLETGHHCYTKCLICDFYKRKRYLPSTNISTKRIYKLIDAGFDKIKFCGNDPLTTPNIGFLLDILDEHNIKSDFATTLLTKDDYLLRRILKNTRLKVSIHGVYEDYHKSYRVREWETFIRNFYFLCKQYKGEFIINYTFIDHKKYSNFSLKQADLLVVFLESVGFPGTLHTFPAHGEWSNENKLRIDLFNETVSQSNFKVKFFGFKKKKMKKCTVNDKRLYIKSNGEVYPCCMAGGEVGNQVLSELYLGNIDHDPISKIMDPTILYRVNNYICNNCTPKYFNLMG